MYNYQIENRELVFDLVHGIKCAPCIVKLQQSTIYLSCLVKISFPFVDQSSFYLLAFFKL